MPQFDLVTLEKVAAGRHVEEEVLDHHPRPDLAGHGLGRLGLASFDDVQDAELIFGTAGAQLHPGNARDARQGLSPEAHRGEGEQVVG